MCSWRYTTSICHVLNCTENLNLWEPGSTTTTTATRSHSHNHSMFLCPHYTDVIMGVIASQITDVSIVYSTVWSSVYKKKHQSSASLAFLRGIPRWPVNSPHKGPVTRKMFPFDDVIMYNTWMVEAHGGLYRGQVVHQQRFLFFQPGSSKHLPLTSYLTTGSSEGCTGLPELRAPFWNIPCEETLLIKESHYGKWERHVCCNIIII